jgi:DNA (cytosine-5)-methyltransferase 1
VIKIIDLFAGIGGIRMGVESALGKKNVKCVFTSEIDKFAVQTYRANYWDEELVHGDITKIHENDIPDHDLLLAGFPCQPFSQAGLKRGFADTRGTLFFDIQRIISQKKPKAILLENVKQLKGHDKGRTLAIILDSLRDEGYVVWNQILSARDFGVPQNRERIFIVGFRDSRVNFEFPRPLNIETKVGDILESNVDPKYTLSDKLWRGHLRRKAEHEEKGNGFGFSLFDKDSEYTNTISARYYKDGSEILIKQGRKNPRKLTPREAARLQGYSDSFVIPVSDGQAYKQFGNSVAVPVIKAIAKQMKPWLLMDSKMVAVSNQPRDRISL